MCTLLKKGAVGAIAVALFRAQKASERAKRYHGGIRHGDGSYSSYRELAYEKKREAIDQLDKLLSIDPAGLTWGWGTDPSQPRNQYVLYVDLPCGQVSFHSPLKGSDHEYLGTWDGVRGASPDRIVQFCQSVLDGNTVLSL